MSRIYIPVSSAEQWQDFLADPDKQWKPGYSARALAYCWQEADGFPPSVARVLSQLPQFKELQMLLGLPEHKVSLPGGSRPSQTDIWVLAGCADGLVSIAVEGKVSESFGPSIAEWDYDSTPGRRERLEFLCSLLEVEVPPPPDVRYQLFHRAASAILEAQRFRAQNAVLLVHSFSQTEEGFDDYARFASLLGWQVEVNFIASGGNRSGVDFFLAWVRGEEKYLEM